MTKKKIINNPRLYDSSSKLIFGDNILCSQFPRDYANMEILKNIQQKDENPLNLPLYIVSLIEHKSKVEYNEC